MSIQQQVLEFFAGKMFIVSGWDVWYLDDFADEARPFTTKPMDIVDLLHWLNVEVVDFASFDGKPTDKWFEILGSITRDLADGRQSLWYAEDFVKAQAEKDRLELEGTAAAFAKSCGHKVGTEGFWNALCEAIGSVESKQSRWNDGETRAECWAACMYSGAGKDAYYDDLNYINDKFDTELDLLYRLHQWLEQNFPLLCMQMEAQQAEAQEDE